MQKEMAFLPAFKLFVTDSEKGKRLKPNGQRIKPQTVSNYHNTFQLLEEFSKSKNFELRIRHSNKLNMREMKIELNYWKKFYRQFSEFLYKDRGCFDNYVGSIFKTIRVFFGYLKKDKLLQIGEFHKSFFVRKEEIPIVTLTPEQLQFLISNLEFDKSLSLVMRRTKDFFVFGCTVALRYSDLFNIRVRDVEEISRQYYLCAKSIKTDFVTKVKLPQYAIDIIKKYSKRKSGASNIFKNVSKNQVNRNIRKLAELAGWTNNMGKNRRQNGKDIEVYTAGANKSYRFCDLLSSHTMRRTAVTTMLMLGMPEHVVRKISGHSANSKAFYRYVNFVQSYLDTEIDKVHEKMRAA